MYAHAEVQYKGWGRGGGVFVQTCAMYSSNGRTDNYSQNVVLFNLLKNNNLF
jgi:hypothetical protein